MTLPRTMSGVLLTAHGGPDVLNWRQDIPVPRPGHDDVLVQVLAAGVNNTDINTRIGWYAKDGSDDGGWSGALPFPLIQGGDLCGRIVALGAHVTGWHVGQRVTCPINQPEPTPDNPFRMRVIGSEYNGAFAQFCAVPACHLYDVTAAPLSDIEIAAMPCAFGTAENLLARAGVSAGQRVLITGASGGVGLAAVQLAHLRGATITAICGASKAQAVQRAGAAVTRDRDAPLPKQQFDVVIDLVGGAQFAPLIAALRPGGRYAVAGAIGGAIVSADLRDIYLNDLTLFGCTYQDPAVFAGLIAHINAGRVRPLIAATYPMRDIAAAQADFMSKTKAGKFVLIPAEPSI